MSQEIPALPPRKMPTTNQIEKQAETLLDCPCYSPMALLTDLETFSSDHRHVFKCLIADNNSNNPDQESAALEETEDSVLVSSSTTSRYICKVCHVWLIVQRNKEQAETCPATDYLCHHYHSQGYGGYECCGCQYSLATEISGPILSMSVLKRLEATRVKARSYVDLMQAKGDLDPTLVSTYTTVLVYIKDLLNGVKRNINSVNPHFLSRIGLNEGSHALLEAIGFYFDDNYFIAPEIEAGSPAEERLKQLQHEIILSLDSLRQELGSTVVPVTSAEANFKVKTADMQQLFGIVSSLETRFTSSDDYVNKAYASFGLTSGASDKLVSWAYKMTMSDPSIIMDEHEAMDNLMKIANHTNSVVLQTLIACERSQGKIGRNDIGDAYAYFGVTEETADDQLLMGLYNVKLSDEPLEKSTIQDKLKTIAIARNSTDLIQFLKEEKGITSSTNIQSVEESMGVPAHMIHNPSSIPVGLNNIGNTCYLNSLLQYYYTLLPFRDTVFNIEDYAEDENSREKKINNIIVGPSEVRRAKKFVGLLRDLFLQLQHSTEKAISPDIELAYMALINDREDEEEEDSTPTTTTKDAPQPKQQEAPKDPDVNMDSNTSTTAEDAPKPKQKQAPKDSDVNMDFTEQDSDDSYVSPLPSVQPIYDPFGLIRSDSPPPAYSSSSSTSSTSSKPEEPEKKPAAASTTKAPVRKPKQRPSVDNMMFGRQQDVAECMNNIMYLVEAALKPLHQLPNGEMVDDMIRQLFYYKTRQIVSYRDNNTMQVVKLEKEEDLSHVVVNALEEDKDIYDGLDDYFFAGPLEDFTGGQEATREVTVKSFPPVVQILIQRVQFDRKTSAPYKSNVNIHLEKTIYLDRYADDNYDAFEEKRKQAAEWKTELKECKDQVARYSTSDTCNIPIPDMLEATRQVLQESSLQVSSTEEKVKYNIAMDVLQKEAQKTKKLVQQCNLKIQKLKQQIQQQYNVYTQLAYNLHAVFIHQGAANYGHYWVYIYDHHGDQWWKYSDSLVTKASESEVLQDTTGSTANPYFLIYVDANKMDVCVETINRSQE